MNGAAREEEETLQLHLRAQIAEFSLRFACEDCTHFDPGSGACGHGYPTAPHRSAAREVTFCKEFELG